MRHRGLAWFATCALLGCTSTPPAPARPPNVLFIAIDDLRPELGCYGVAWADTPRLDAFADQAVVFTRHYASSPSCGPSRYALLTGRSPRTSGATRDNRAFYKGTPALDPEPTAGAQSLPELFRRNGYHTTLIGKLSHTPDGKVFAYDGSGDGHAELPRAWDELATPVGSWERGWGAFFAYAGGRHREDGGDYSPLMEFVAERDSDLPDGLMAERAVQVLRELRASEQPFFLGLGFYKPHLPFVATRADWEAMQGISVPPPPSPTRPASAYWHASSEFRRYQNDFADDAALTGAEQIETRRAYLACVRFVDRQVGKVLDELERLGLAENTIVVVWGDHGWHLGDSGIWGKHTPHERALRSTLIVRAPGALRGLHTAALVDSLDLYPTLVELAGLEDRRTRWPLDGLSQVPVLRGERDSVRNAVTSYWGHALSVRSRDYRLIATRGGDGSRSREELYRVSEDPDPRRDLARELPEVAARLADLGKPRGALDSN